jgi:phosphoribosylaminoimidazole-succinocarboxamide synthase
MNAPKALFQSNLTSLKLRARGKVRDIYDIDDKLMLIVTTDRLSAFDVILPDPIPGKGLMLTRISNFWFNKLKHIIPNHLTGVALSDIISGPAEREQIEGRAIVVRRYKPLPVEAIVRGYLIGSGWKDYQKSGAICGISLPSGLQQAQQLPQPIYTPSTKAAAHDHDENVTFEHTAGLIGVELAEKIRVVSLNLYQEAAAYAEQRGIIIADTKFEFGVDNEGGLYLIDEVLTPDSSRFWPKDQYRIGISPPSFDKQYVRDYLETLDWNKSAPGPELPPDVLEHCAAKYREAEARLTSA